MQRACAVARMAGGAGGVARRDRRGHERVGGPRGSPHTRSRCGSARGWWPARGSPSPGRRPGQSCRAAGVRAGPDDRRRRRCRPLDRGGHERVGLERGSPHTRSRCEIGTRLVGAARGSPSPAGRGQWSWCAVRHAVRVARVAVLVAGGDRVDHERVRRRVAALQPIARWIGTRLV